MYGSDYPCCDPQPVLDSIDELGLGADDRQKVFYDNAVRILGLKTAVPV
jgi:aminocarboxymuconate-semialdehyde decarboxylase